jgi:hypothetical protein
METTVAGKSRHPDHGSNRVARSGKLVWLRATSLCRQVRAAGRVALAVLWVGEDAPRLPGGYCAGAV